MNSSFQNGASVFYKLINIFLCQFNLDSFCFLTVSLSFESQFNEWITCSTKIGCFDTSGFDNLKTISAQITIDVYFGQKLLDDSTRLVFVVRFDIQTYSVCVVAWFCLFVFWFTGFWFRVNQFAMFLIGRQSNRNTKRCPP